MPASPRSARLPLLLLAVFLGLAVVATTLRREDPPPPPPTTKSTPPTTPPDAAAAPAHLSIEAITNRVVERLKATYPDMDVEVRSPGRLSISRGDEPGAELGLTSVVRVCQGGGDCDGRIDEIVRFADTMLSNQHAPLQRSQVLPIVRTSDYLTGAARMQFSGERAGERFLTRPLAGDLVQTYAIDMPTSLRLFTSADLGPLGLKARDVDALARRNLEALIPGELRYVPAAPGSSVHVIEEESDYTSSLLILHDRFAPLQRVVKRPPVLVMAPCRNLLVFTGSGDPEAVKEMLALAARMEKTQAHPLSRTLLAWYPDGWRVAPQ